MKTSSLSQKGCFSSIWRPRHCKRRAAILRLLFMTFEKGGILIVPHLLWHGTSVIVVLSEKPPDLVVFTTQNSIEDLFRFGFPRVAQLYSVGRPAQNVAVVWSLKQTGSLSCHEASVFAILLDETPQFSRHLRQSRCTDRAPISTRIPRDIGLSGWYSVHFFLDYHNMTLEGFFCSIRIWYFDFFVVENFLQWTNDNSE